MGNNKTGSHAKYNASTILANVSIHSNNTDIRNSTQKNKSSSALHISGQKGRLIHPSASRKANSSIERHHSVLSVLSGLNLSHYAPAFSSNHISLADLIGLQEPTLLLLLSAPDLKIALKHRLQILLALKKKEKRRALTSHA